MRLIRLNTIPIRIMCVTIHSVRRAQNHLAWDNSIPPVLRVQSGETVTFDCIDSSNGQVTKDSHVSAVAGFIYEQMDPVTGPVYINGAMPGDTLQVDVVSIDIPDWGWTGLIPGFGFLADEFPEAALKIWTLDRTNMVAYFDETKKIKVPLNPFPGEMGVAQGKPGAFSTIPPYNTGGNLDTKYLTVGSTLYLPIEVEGALFSIGDGHAAQGDGEVCGTAIEIPMKATVRLTVLKDKPYTKAPHYRTVVKKDDSPKAGEFYCTTGVGPDIKEATRQAVKSMIEYLMIEHKMSRVDAYILCSVTADLRLHEVVDMPNFVVGMMLPQSIFV